MLIHLLFVIAFVFDRSVPVMAQSYTDGDSLMAAVLTGYNNMLRPVINVNDILSVNVKFSPAAIVEFDFVKETMHIAALVSTSWVDEKIMWSPASHGNLNELLIPQSQVWVPPIVLTNPSEKVALFGQDWMYIRYNSSGFAAHIAAQVLKATCPLDVTYWPFDKQTCTFTFACLGYASSEVVFVSSEVDLAFYDANGEWDLTGASGITSSLLTTPSVVYTLQLTRRPTFLLVNLLLPVIFLMCLNACVFFLPAESGERVGYAITVLLSISVFFTVLSDFIPSTSQPMAAVTYYIMINFLISILICFGTMVSLRLHLTPETEPCPKWCNKFVRIVLWKWTNNEVDIADKEKNQLQNKAVLSPQHVRFSKEGSESERPSQQCQQSEVTRKMLGIAVDRVLFGFFSLVIIAVTMWFLIAMAVGAY